jgi:chromosome segregation ATPase
MDNSVAWWQAHASTLTEIGQTYRAERDDLRTKLESVQRKYAECRQDAVQLHRERDELRKELTYERSKNHTYSQGVKLQEMKIESLQRDKAALIEVLEWYGYDDADNPEPYDSGKRVRAILKALEADTHE